MIAEHGRAILAGFSPSHLFRLSHFRLQRHVENE